MYVANDVLGLKVVLTPLDVDLSYIRVALDVDLNFIREVADSRT